MDLWFMLSIPLYNWNRQEDIKGNEAVTESMVGVAFAWMLHRCHSDIFLGMKETV